MPLRHDGNIRIRGLVNDRCQGSGRPPLSVQVVCHVLVGLLSLRRSDLSFLSLGFCRESLLGTQVVSKQTCHHP